MHVENTLGRNLQTRCSTALHGAVDSAKGQMTGIQAIDSGSLVCRYLYLIWNYTYKYAFAQVSNIVFFSFHFLAVS